MQATLEKNHLLTIENPTLDTGRTYQQDFQGLKITEENKLFFVLHKKEIKLIELKNIGSTMGVFYIRERALFDHMNLVPAYVHLAGEHFGGFDEETGERYHFLPYFSPQRVEETNKVLEQIGISFPLSHTTKGVVAPWTNTLDLPAGGSIEELLSHFF
ncbi:MAG: hypothetical protein LBD11_02660 [Candidatus Peribacteria bacterium]|jgi:hypothetical protein|nr:hypothetical protein [Candidatus Peribacteria bacterium]